MTTTTLPNRYQINGLVDTNNNVLANMETLATTAGSLISFDATTGKWNVVILKTESTTRTFTDSDIIGGISVNGSGLDEMYNSVMVEFPLRDTADEVDFVRVALSASDRNPNEPDNELIIQLAQCNEPVQAEIIALQELKQSRADLIVTFQTDWTASDINPGNVIGITNSPYGWTDKLFRVITIERIEDGAITYSITAQQYDPLVYDTSNLNRFVRSDRNGIRAAGAIGTPVQPQVTDFKLVARPRLSIETTVPSGLVESMEFWLSSDGTNYSQVAEEFPVGGGNFPPGTTVTTDFDRLDGQNVYVKTRGMNSTTTGPFSPASTLLAFVPQQQTDAIGNTTDVVDGSGSSLLGLTGANGLMALLKGLMDDQETGNNPFTGGPGLFKEVFDVFDTDTGSDIRLGEVPGTGPGLTWTAEQGLATGIIPQSSSSTNYQVFASTTFTVPVTGTYLTVVGADQNSSGAIGGRGSAFSEDADYEACQIVLFDITGGGSTVVDSEASGGIGAFFWTDFVLNMLTTLDSTKTYKLEFRWLNYTESNPTGSADVTISYNITSYRI